MQGIDLQIMYAETFLDTQYLVQLVAQSKPLRSKLALLISSLGLIRLNFLQLVL